MQFTYTSGEEIRQGDHVRYHGEPGEVAFVVSGATGEPIHDWYLTQFPNGGFMLEIGSLGSMFLTESDEDLELVSRGESVKASSSGPSQS